MRSQWMPKPFAVLAGADGERHRAIRPGAEAQAEGFSYLVQQVFQLCEIVA